MTVATNDDSNAKSNQATFLKVGQNLYRNESSSTYYGLTKRGGKQFRTALRMEDGTPIKDRGLAERALRKWLNELENIRPEATERDENFAIVKKEGAKKVLVGGLAKRWLDIQSPNLKPGCVERYDQHIRGLAPFFKDVPLKKISALHCEDWLTNRASKLAKLTFKHELALMRTLLKYAIERGAIAKDPSRGIKAPRGTPRKLARKKIHIPTKEQFFALIDTIRKSGTKSKPGDKGYEKELAENQRKAKAGTHRLQRVGSHAQVAYLHWRICA